MKSVSFLLTGSVWDKNISHEFTPNHFSNDLSLVDNLPKLFLRIIKIDAL